MHPDHVVEIVRKTRRIPGWFSFEAAMLFGWIDDIQRKNGIRGDLFEIGVHHGKSAVVLAALVQAPDESLGVCDLFADQALNKSASGSGSSTAFQRNMAEFAPAVRLRVFATRSQSLEPAEIGTNHRFFHIDGGHDADETLGDLQLAADTICPGGAIVLDDPFRPEWPGVTEALFRFLTVRPDYRAILVGFNKMIIARREYADLYVREFDNTAEHESRYILHPWRMKMLPFFGHPLRIFYVPSFLSKHSPRARLARFLRSSSLGRLPSRRSKP